MQEIRRTLHGNRDQSGWLETCPAPIRSLMAGGLSGLVETTISHPIDLSKVVRPNKENVHIGAIADPERASLHCSDGPVPPTPAIWHDSMHAD